MRPIFAPSPASPARRLRSALVLAAAGLLLAGCASGPASDSAGHSNETRTVTDALGTVEVPTDPQRIVSTDFFSSSVLVDVGVTPVGVMQGIDADDPDARPSRYYEALKDIPGISTYAEINVEKVLDLNPDLIIVDSAFSQPETIERLAEIAPLFNVDLSGSWSDRALSIADAANRLDEATEQQQRYEERVAEVAKTHRELLDRASFGVLALHPSEATWSSYLPGGWPTPVWMDLGITFREHTAGESTEGEFLWLPDEQLEKLENADALLVVDHNQLARYDDNPLWNSLPSVKNGAAVRSMPAPATSSFLWGLDNLDSADEILAELDSRVPAAAK